MPFALVLALRAVFGKLRDVEFPGTDEASVKIHFASTIGRGAVGAERIEEWGSGHAALRPSAFCIASAA